MLYLITATRYKYSGCFLSRNVASILEGGIPHFQLHSSPKHNYAVTFAAPGVVGIGCATLEFECTTTGGTFNARKLTCFIECPTS